MYKQNILATCFNNSNVVLRYMSTKNTKKNQKWRPQTKINDKNVFLTGRRLNKNAFPFKSNAGNENPHPPKRHPTQAKKRLHLSLLLDYQRKLK